MATIDVDKYAGGGATIGIDNSNQSVYISGNENKMLTDTEGKPLRDEAADILMHELVGHAIPHILGEDTGNAVENENKAREQLKPGQNQKRAAEPIHNEDPSLPPCTPYKATESEKDTIKK